jgi:hypothetical protein
MAQRFRYVSAALVLCALASAQQVLLANDGAAGDSFGEALSVSNYGNQILIGAPYKIFANTSARGAAYVFFLSGGSSWTQQELLPPLVSGGYVVNTFGFAVALTGDGMTALVGAPNLPGTNGYAFVFAQSGTTWADAAQLLSTNSAENDQFGFAVAANANSYSAVAIVGAPGVNCDSGEATVFTNKGGAVGWQPSAVLNLPFGVCGDKFGSSVSMSASGTCVVVGAPSMGTLGTGKAYLFSQNVAGQWTLTANFSVASSKAGDAFGYSVAVDASCSAVAVGAPHAGTAGAAYAFILNSDGVTWSEAQLTPSDGAAGDGFGWSVAMATVEGGLGVVIGSPQATPQHTGAAYVFGCDVDGQWLMTAEYGASGAVPGFSLGVAVGAGNNVVVAGGNVTINGPAVGKGAAYVF